MTGNERAGIAGGYLKQLRCAYEKKEVPTGEVGLLKTDPHVGTKCRRGWGRWWRIVAIIVTTILFVLSFEVIYVVLYICRASKINTDHGSEWLKVSELPENCAKYVETHGCPDDGSVLVRYYDIDDDGIDELLLKARGPRGADNSWWWAIWQKGSSGAYRCLGKFYCVDLDFAVPWYIYGMPIVCCYLDGQYVWVPWKDGGYKGVGEDGESHGQK